MLKVMDTSLIIKDQKCCNFGLEKKRLWENITEIYIVERVGEVNVELFFSKQQSHSKQTKGYFKTENKTKQDKTSLHNR